MTKTQTIEELDATANAALLKAAAAQNAADKIRAESYARQQDRLEAHDRKVLAAWDRQPLEKEVTAARMRLKQAIESDETWQAIIAVLVAEHRRYQLFHQASGLSATYDGRPFANPPNTAQAISFDTLANIADQLASEKVADEMNARDQARHAAGEGHTAEEKS